LIQIVGLKLAPIVLSLNASFMYLGFSLGAAVGGFTLLHATVTDLGWVGAACELAALMLFLKTRAAARAQGTPADERTSPCAST
jgi:predicted MFS family arabinose efflux permease